MTMQLRIQKIIDIKEIEKNEMVAQYNEAIASFEFAATKLYDLLKTKENYESLIENEIGKGLSINQIKHYQRYVENIERSILHQQQIVSELRKAMQTKEEQLLVKNIEVKKFEKIKEQKLAYSKEVMKLEDSKAMDEISIQQYMSRGN